MLVYGNRNLEINHNGRFAINLLNNMSQLKYPANKQNTTEVNKKKLLDRIFFEQSVVIHLFVKVSNV